MFFHEDARDKASGVFDDEDFGFAADVSHLAQVPKTVIPQPTYPIRITKLVGLTYLVGVRFPNFKGDHVSLLLFFEPFFFGELGFHIKSS